MKKLHRQRAPSTPPARFIERIAHAGVPPNAHGENTRHQAKQRAGEAIALVVEKVHPQAWLGRRGSTGEDGFQTSGANSTTLRATDKVECAESGSGGMGAVPVKGNPQAFAKAVCGGVTQ